MILVKLEGGLGNQMFQYALGRKLSIKTRTELALDTNLYHRDIGLTLPRAYGLSHFNIEARIATEEEIQRIRNPYGMMMHKIYRRFEQFILGRKHLKYEPFILNKTGDISLEGYWQSEKYFRDIRDVLLGEYKLKKELTPDGSELAQKIVAEKYSISLHVRRTDYVSSEKNIRFYGSYCNQNYYKKAVETIVTRINIPDIHVFVFSDDIQWVKENLDIPYKKTYVSETTIPDYERMVLMSYCDHHIIANSTFSWWGAWLNDKKEKIVVAPSIWIPGVSLPVSDIIPPEWIKI